MSYPPQGKVNIDEIVSALLGYNGVYWHTFFESIDGFEVDISGAGAITCRENYIKLLTGALENDYALVTKYPYLLNVDLSWDKRKRMKTRFQIPAAIGDSEAWLVSGEGGEWGATQRHLGFKSVNGTLYGTVANGTTESTLELATITASDKPTIEFIYNPGEECRFFVDDVDKGALTTNLPSGVSGASLMFFACMKTTTTAARWLVISEWRFLQEP